MQSLTSQDHHETNIVMKGEDKDIQSEIIRFSINQEIIGVPKSLIDSFEDSALQAFVSGRHDVTLKDGAIDIASEGRDPNIFKHVLYFIKHKKLDQNISLEDFDKI